MLDIEIAQINQYLDNLHADIPIDTNHFAQLVESLIEENQELSSEIVEVKYDLEMATDYSTELEEKVEELEYEIASLKEKYE